jgi:hypothetical protein
MKYIALFGFMIFVDESIAQNVGIGVASPGQRLDVDGNVQFSGALMPGGISGNTGEVLISQGANTPPVWSKINSSSNLTTAYYAAGSTDVYITAKLNPNGYTLLPQMSITFIPSHNKAVVHFTATGTYDWDEADEEHQIRFSVWKDGVMQREFWCATREDINYWGTSFHYPLNVSAGISTTVEIWWDAMRTEENNAKIYNNVSSTTNENRVFTIYDLAD